MLDVHIGEREGERLRLPKGSAEPDGINEFNQDPGLKNPPSREAGDVLLGDLYVAKAGGQVMALIVVDVLHGPYPSDH